MNAVLLRASVAVLAIVILAGGGFAAGVRWERDGWEARWQERNAQDAQAAADQQALARATEQANQRRNQEIQDDATQQIDRARADADAGRADADRLRKQVALLSAKRCPTGDTGASTSSQADARAGVLLNDVFGWSVDRAAELAEAYDRARIAGLACESAYDSLRRQQ